MTKNPKLSIFPRFYGFFVKISRDFVNWKVLSSQQEKVGCPVVFYEQIIAMFSMKTCQIDTENDKSVKIL